MKILVVDDEKIIVKGIRFNLQNEYDVDVGYDGEQALEMARTNEYDLIILDLMMPKMDGLQVCLKIREFSDVPIIMLTARSEDADKIIGLESGADDYITKPFNILELKARIRALIRRSGMKEKQQKKVDSEILTVGGLSLDLAKRIARKEEIEVPLTVREFDLLELFMRNPGRVYSRDSLLDLVWGYDFEGDPRTVDVHVRRLREKVEKDSANPTIICTKWGVGYYLNQS